VTKEDKGFNITGQMNVGTLKKRFKKEFGLTLRLYDGNKFADDGVSIASIRKKKGKAGSFEVRKSIKVENLEKRFEKEFGIKVQVAGSDDSYLCDDEITLASALRKDEKRLGRKAKKVAPKEDVGDDGDEVVEDAQAVRYYINYKTAEYASTIQWISDDYKIEDLNPYISAIICDGGKEYEELWGDDFKVISFDSFDPKEGDNENTFILCYTATVEFEPNNFPKFREALEHSSYQVEVKIDFKTKEGDEIDEEIWEGYSDVPVELKILSDDDSGKYGEDEQEKEYFINHDKARDACSIIWESDDYKISELEPYIYAIVCDDGEDYHELLSPDWPDVEGGGDFKTIELNNFEAIEGDGENEYLLCFNALISTDLNKHPSFKKALEKSGNQVIARIQFKKNGKPIVDKDGNEEYLYEMNDDTYVELEEPVYEEEY